MTGRVGRPHWSPTQADREKIQAMAAFGIPQEKIAAVFKVSDKTLRKHCKTELETAEALANSAVGRFLYDAATGKESYMREDGTIGLRPIGVNSASVTAAIFWMKTRANWRETTLHSGNGPEGASRSFSAKAISGFSHTPKQREELKLLDGPQRHTF